MTALPTLHLKAKNLYGTIRYFPDCQMSVALAKVRGKKTLLMGDINVLRGAGFPFNITNDKGEVLE